MEDGFPNSNLDYIWLEEEVEAEKAYQKRWMKNEGISMIMFAIGLAIAYIIFVILDEML